ncbi:hypothetical protein ACTJJ0_20925 [Chitinophaga sp. 22321]|uniref:Uncharacterized protein n=1 Tax=Chitinophaga hostae TaxID=2831022 RepID=A0ABS5J4E7_9BACT|nr:hypothetical protein [Chitinophaga hostae]MBS0029950.1 hypothetical protein [Chitinophaga hostae]
MKKAFLLVPLSLYCCLMACSSQPTNVHIGGGVSAFIKDSADFNSVFKNDLLICNFNFDGVNNSDEKIDTTLIIDAHETEFSKVMKHTKKEELHVAIIANPVYTDSIKLKGLSDKLVAYLQKDPLFGGFKKYTINIAPDGSRLSVYTY